VDIVGRSHVGRVRKTNEDEIAVDAELRIGVLADGMGGLEAGEVASRAAVTEILMRAERSRRRDEAWLKSAIDAANRRVLALSRQNGAMPMGTTLVVWIDAGEGQCYIGHVGDSRAYRLRSGVLEALTEDHSVVQQMVRDGLISEAEARMAPNRNVITRAVGLDPVVDAEVRSWVRGPGDVFLLCSDGLTDMLTEQELELLLNARLSPAGEGDLHDAADSLIEAANDAGGVDNVSVVLVRPPWPPLL